MPVTSSFSDTFTRADAAHLGSPWTEAANGSGTGWLGIVSNHAVPNTWDSSQQLWATHAGGLSGTYSLTITSLEAGSSAAGIIVRRVDANNHILVYVTATTMILYEQIGASYTALSTAAISLAPGDVLSAVVAGRSITAKLNGTTICTGSTSLVGNLYGIFAQAGSSGTTSFADFSYTADVVSLPFSDNFNRADGAVGAPWVESDGGTEYQVASNVLAKNTLADNYLRLDTGSADFDIQLTLTVGSFTNYSGIHARALQVDGDGAGHPYGDYAFLFPDPVESDNTGHLTFYIWYSGGRVDEFVTTVPQPTAGDIVTLRLRGVGARVTGWFNGTQVMDKLVTNTAYLTNTFHGIGMYSNNGGTIDNFSIAQGVDAVSLPFVDTFTRADSGSLGAPWLELLGRYKVVSDVGVQNGGGGLPWAPAVTAALAVVDSGVLDHSVEIVTTATSLNTASPMARCTDDQDFIILDPHDGHVFDVIAGVVTAKLTVSASPGDTLKLSVLGTTVEAFVNGVSQGTYTTTITTGTYAGVYGYDSNGAGLTSEMARFEVDSLDSLTVDLLTFHEVEVFYGAAPLFLLTFHEIEVFYGAAPPPPIEIDLLTYHEEEIFYGLLLDFVEVDLLTTLHEVEVFYPFTGPVGPPIVIDLFTFHEIEVYYPTPPPLIVDWESSFHETEVFFGVSPFLQTYQVVRWIFTDPVTGETYVFPLNPNQMTTPYLKHATTLVPYSPISGAASGMRTQDLPVEWSFQGNIREQAQYDAFVYWAAKPNRIYITDHLGRKFLCWIVSFEPVPKPTSVRRPWRHTYTIKAINYGRIGAPR